MRNLKNHVAFVNSLKNFNYDLNNIDFEGIQERMRYKKALKGDVKCAMSEQLVECALKEQGFQFFSDQDVLEADLAVVENYYNLKFFKGSSPIFEFDFAGIHKDNFYVVETKSNNLHRYLDDVDDVLKNAEYAFKKDPRLLVFASFKSNVDLSEVYSKDMKAVSIIDMGISPKNYECALNQYFSNQLGDDFNNEISDILRSI